MVSNCFCKKDRWLEFIKPTLAF